MWRSNKTMMIKYYDLDSHRISLLRCYQDVENNLSKFSHQHKRILIIDVSLLCQNSIRHLPWSNQKLTRILKMKCHDNIWMCQGLLKNVSESFLEYFMTMSEMFQDFVCNVSGSYLQNVRKDITYNLSDILSYISIIYNYLFIPITVPNLYINLIYFSLKQM